MKKILISTTVIICSIAIGLGIYVNNSTSGISTLMLQNIQALADAKSNEDDGDRDIEKWYKVDRPDGGYNCSIGGTSKCR